MTHRGAFVLDLGLWLPESFGRDPVHSTASNSWCASPPRHGLADIVKSLDVLAKLPPAEKPLRIVACRELGAGRVYQERWRFSGGVNLSAAARNAERLAEAEKREGTVYVEKATGNVYCSPKAAAKLAEQLPNAPRGPAPLELNWNAPFLPPND